jgi:excisionase family DNA binding protein
MLENNQLEKLLTAKEIAAILRIKPYTVRKMAREGTIPNFIKIGQEWRIAKEDLQEWINKQKR